MIAPEIEIASDRERERTIVSATKSNCVAKWETEVSEDMYITNWMLRSLRLSCTSQQSMHSVSVQTVDPSSHRHDDRA